MSEKKNLNWVTNNGAPVQTPHSVAECIANTGDPDQISNSLAYDLGLHCSGLSVPILRFDMVI